MARVCDLFLLFVLFTLSWIEGFVHVVQGAITKKKWEPLAIMLGIDASTIKLVLTPASVRIGVTIKMPDEPSASALVDRIRAADLAAFSSALGVTVEAVGAVTMEIHTLGSTSLGQSNSALSPESADGSLVHLFIAIFLPLCFFGICLFKMRRKYREWRPALEAAFAKGNAETRTSGRMSEVDMASNWGTNADRASPDKVKTTFVNPAILALIEELENCGVDLVPWAVLNLDGLFHQGSIGKLFKCSVPTQFGEKKLLMRRVRRDVLTAVSAEQMAKQLATFINLSHHHVCPLLGVACDDAISFGLLEERMPRSLASVLASATRSEKTAALVHSVQLHLMTDLASGLEYLHNQKIGHFSLHPENILLDGGLQVKISDYGRTPQLLHLAHA